MSGASTPTAEGSNYLTSANVHERSLGRARTNSWGAVFGVKKTKEEEELEIASSSASLAKQIIMDSLQAENRELAGQLEGTQRYTYINNISLNK